MRLSVAVLAVTVLAGCAGVPFEKSGRKRQADVVPEETVRRFGLRVPTQFSMVTTVMFRYNWLRKMSAVGMIEADRANKSFVVACFNPLGLKLFEVASEGGEIEERFTMRRLAEMGDVAAAVGRDIGRVYFDVIPPAEAAVEKGKYETVFSMSTQAGTTQYFFGGPEGDLLQKRFEGADGAVDWAVHYYEYRDGPGGRMPYGIVFDSREFGYRLIVKTKEVYANAEN